MNYHIIRTNETLGKIARMYNLTETEIRDLNRHITVWDRLVPGTRIKLPSIPDAVVEELNDVEPFIEDYYPKLDSLKYESDVCVEEKEELNNIYNKEEIKEITEKSEQEVVKNSSFNNSIKLPKNYNYYYNPYDYYKYLQRKRLNKK